MKKKLKITDLEIQSFSTSTGHQYRGGTFYRPSNPQDCLASGISYTDECCFPNPATSDLTCGNTQCCTSDSACSYTGQYYTTCDGSYTCDC